jgi:hypothetical protein
MTERINYTLNCATSGNLIVNGITTGNINFKGTLYQNGSPYVGSQFTTTSGNVSYTSGSIVGTLVSATNMISTNQTTGTLVVSSGITTGNINFTGSLSQNGSPYIGSQFTTTSGNVSYTSGSIVGTLVSATNIISTNPTTGTLIVSSGITTSNINFTGNLYQNGTLYTPSLKGFQISATTGNAFVVQYDTNNNYNNTTGTFTAPKSGLYTINLNGIGNVYITSANTFIPTSGNYRTNAYISAGNTLKCIVTAGGTVSNWGIIYI